MKKVFLAMLFVSLFVSASYAVGVSVIREGIDVDGNLVLGRGDFNIIGSVQAETEHSSILGIFNDGMAGFGKTVLLTAAKAKYGDQVDDIVGIKADKYCNNVLFFIYNHERVVYNGVAIKYVKK